MLGGYLGAGKTTLVNDLLATTTDERTVVVVNDFGSVNVDAGLVRSRSEDTLELTNGCVCCSLADGMAAVMDRIRELRPPPDRVVVEVSGVGDPAAVAGWGDHPGFRRGPVVVCADVVSVREHAGDRWVGDVVLDQLAGADVVLLTKADLMAADAVDRAAAWVAERAPGARLLRDRAEVRGLLATAVPTSGTRAGGQSHQHDEVHTTWTVSGDGPLSSQDLEQVLRERPRSVVRVKGVVAIEDGSGARRTVVNAMDDQIELTDTGPWTDGDDAHLVLIETGPGRDEPELVDRLRRLLGRSGQ